MKKFKKLLTFIILICVYCLLVSILPRPHVYKGENPFRKEANNNIPFISTHQGSNELYPSNTIIAFRETLENYTCVTDFELDVRVTKDGVVLVSHDSDLKSRTNIEEIDPGKNNYKVKNYTYDFLMENVDFAYDFEKDCFGNPFVREDYLEKYSKWIIKDSKGKNGYSIKACTLEQFFDEFVNEFPNVKYSVDIKDEGEYGKIAMEEMNRLLNLEKYGDLKSRVIVASFNKDNHDYMQQNYDFIQSPSMGHMINYAITYFTFTDYIYNDDIISFQIPHYYDIKGIIIRLDTKRMIKNMHKKNLAVQYWTIDDYETMESLIKNGADCIITNRPDIAQQVLIDLGYIK